VFDGRRLYTAGDMREYGQACAKAELAQIYKSAKQTAGGKSPVEELFGIFGMKK
jgi:hypothetical protein